MSEPIFRAWDNKDKFWIKDFYVSSSGIVYIDDSCDSFAIREVDATLCRSTGLRDNKRTKEFPDGEMIFEHDIVKCNGYSPGNHVIKFVDGGFCLFNKKLGVTMGIEIHTLYPSIGCQMTVVGSELENPELLEQKQNG